jgi:hypothetical protein
MTGISFQPSASLSAGQLVCITQSYERRTNGTPLIGSALAVGRMAIPSDLVEGGTKGKAIILLHAWKDQLWEMGGEERPPRPRFLRGSLNEADDTDEEWTGEESGATAEMQLEIIENGDTPKELSQEGMFRAGCMEATTEISQRFQTPYGLPFSNQSPVHCRNCRPGPSQSLRRFSMRRISCHIVLFNSQKLWIPRWISNTRDSSP